MKAIPIEQIPVFCSVPLMEICLDERRITLMADSENKERICLNFAPYQAIKLTTEDCFALREPEVIPFRLCVIQDSLWIPQLKEALKQVDSDAIFLDKAKHFILFTTEGALEIVATQMSHGVVNKRKKWSRNVASPWRSIDDFAAKARSNKAPRRPANVESFLRQPDVECRRQARDA